MDIEYIGRVLARLKPFVRDHVIRRTRIERVLATLQEPTDEIRREVERLLAKAGIAIEEDAPPVAAPQARPPAEPTSAANDPGMDAPHDLGAVHNDDAVTAARRRLERDRFITNHARVLLRSEEEVGLAILVRGEADKPLDQGDFARLTGESRRAAECLLLHNQGLVHSVAQRYAPSGMAYDDLFQHGVIGLIRAIELFDHRLGNKFSTYAMNWVRQSIRRGIANEARLIRLPVHIVDRVLKVWAVRTRLTVASETPSVHQIALACNLTDTQVRECLRLGPHDFLSLDTPIGPDGESTLADLLDLADPELNPEREVEFGFLQDELHTVLDTLSEREAGVVSMRFGLTTGEPMTLEEIGKIYGVTRERIRQIEKQSMSKLRHPSRSHVLRPYMYGGVEKSTAEVDEVSEDATEKVTA
ncbi:sigma-70 family RNA polymerase sigma factor [Segeticoccus rhizosphaerae]|uniref:sigma-70 family RNA polymerase sigma factor n=1 Tax=Segeticoccus rhizosphaerae TaxID=1104777 RepID=UPI001396A25C|nr:sigma-70 family RNA polymerase sigma factor [Segeticoccus rhizosphaerae]